MCDPLSLGALALGGLGIGANVIGANQAASARNRVMQQQNALKSKLQSEAFGINTQSRQAYEDTGGKSKARASEIADYARSQSNEAGPSADLVPTAASSIVTQDEAAKRGIARQRTDAQATALGELRGFGSQFGDASLNTARNAQQLGILGDFMAGNANQAPAALEAANHAGDTMKGIGGLALKFGTAGVSAGLSGMPVFGMGGTDANVAALAALRGTPSTGLAASGLAAGASGLPRPANPFSLFGIGGK